MGGERPHKLVSARILTLPYLRNRILHNSNSLVMNYHMKQRVFRGSSLLIGFVLCWHLLLYQSSTLLCAFNISCFKYLGYKIETTAGYLGYKIETTAGYQLVQYNWWYLLRARLQHVLKLGRKHRRHDIPLRAGVQ